MDAILSKYTNQHSRFVVIEGCLVHYRDEGSGEPLLLLHGAFSSLHTFDAWAEHLREQHRIIRMDLIGFGLTGPHPQADYSIPRHVEIVRQLLDMLGIERCAIGGSSLGGWVAWEFALRHTFRVKRLILCASAGFLDLASVPLPFKMARTPLVDRVIRFAIQKPLMEQFVRQVYYDQSLVTPALIDRYYELFTRPGNPEAFLMLVNKSQFRDRTALLHRIVQPTLILWGEQDPWLPVRNAHWFLQRIPNARLVLYDGVGHLPMEELPEESAQEVSRFLLGGSHLDAGWEAYHVGVAR